MPILSTGRLCNNFWRYLFEIFILYKERRCLESQEDYPEKIYKLTTILTVSYIYVGKKGASLLLTLIITASYFPTPQLSQFVFYSPSPEYSAVYCIDERQGEPRRSSLERRRVMLRRNSALKPRSLLKRSRNPAQRGCRELH